MSNPTLINGFEDIVTFIKQQEHRNQKLKEENEKLKQENTQYRMDIDNLKDELHLYKASHTRITEENESLMKSEVRQVKALKIGLDDLKSRLEDVNHTAEEWEDSYNELKQESEESYNELKQKSISQDKKILIQDYIIKNMLYKLLCDNSDVCEFEIDKKWRLKGVESFNIEYSDIMKQVCKEMDDDDWNDCAGTDSHLTLEWADDTVGTILDEPDNIDEPYMYDVKDENRTYYLGDILSVARRHSKERGIEIKRYLVQDGEPNYDDWDIVE